MTPTQRNPFTIVLPWPPSNNHYYAVVRGRKVLSKNGRKYRGDVLVAVAENRDKRTLGNKRISVKVVSHQPTRLGRDLDNMLKAPLDSLGRAGIYDDDSQIDRLTIERGPLSGTEGWLAVEIFEIPAADRREAL